MVLHVHDAHLEGRQAQLMEDFGGRYVTEPGQPAGDAIAQLKELKARALGVVHDPSSPESRDMAWVGELADQLESVTTDIVLPAGLDTWPTFPKLRYLGLDSWRGRVDFSNFPKLEEFSSGSPHLGFEGLFEHCPELQFLQFLGGFPFDDLRALSGLPKLRSLKLQNSRKLTSLTGIEAHASSLVFLDLGLNPNLTSLDGVESLTNLVHLSVEVCNKVVDVAPTGNLPALRYLSLSDNKNLASLEPLRGLVNLEVLYLVAVDYLDMAPLQNIPSLRSVIFPFTRRVKEWQDILPKSETALEESWAFQRSVGT